jgi:hypothetical protein
MPCCILQLAVGECAARTQQLLRDAARQGVSAQQVMLAALETSSSAAAADTPAGTPADTERQLLVSSACNGCCALHCIAHLVCCIDSQSAVAECSRVTLAVARRTLPPFSTLNCCP